MEILDLLTPEGVRLEHAGKRHARELSRVVRPQDMEEIHESGGYVTAEPAVRMSINRAEESYAAYRGSDLLCVFGVGVHDQVQVMWLIGSTHIDKCPLTFWRCSKLVIAYLREKYPLMMNMVYGKNVQTISWLRRLGFTISPPEKWGTKGALFCRATLVTQKIDLSVTERDLAGLRERELRGLIHV